MKIGDYVIKSLLGHGGMASVYQAVVLKDKPELGINSGDKEQLRFYISI